MNFFTFDRGGFGVVIDGVKWITDGHWAARLEWVTGLKAEQRKLLQNGEHWRWGDGGGRIAQNKPVSLAPLLKVPDDAVRYERVGVAFCLTQNYPLIPFLDAAGAIAVLVRGEWAGVFLGCECRGKPGNSLTPLWFLLEGVVQGMIMPIRFTEHAPEEKAELEKIARALAIMGIKP